MVDRDEALRAEVLARLAASRQEMRQILDPPRPAPNADGVRVHPGGFPRSRTLQALMSGRGLGTLGAVAASLVVARPSLALRLLRMLPAGAVAKMLLAQAVKAARVKRQ